MGAEPVSESNGSNRENPEPTLQPISIGFRFTYIVFLSIAAIFILVWMLTFKLLWNLLLGIRVTYYQYRLRLAYLKGVYESHKWINKKEYENEMKKRETVGEIYHEEEV